MSPRVRQMLERGGFVVVALVAAWLLKRHYSSATAEELRWILAPTTELTRLVVGSDFVFRPGEGYLSRELSILISPACAGVNFLVVAFLSLTLGFERALGNSRQRAAWLATSVVAAYLTTLLVNALRICLSVWLAHLAARVLGLTFQGVHRLLGIAVYLAGLMALCLTVKVWLRSRMPVAARASVLFCALGCYVGITLVVPLLRGAAHNPEYWGHAAPVSVLVGLAGALLFAVKGRIWDDGRHEFRTSEHPQPEPIAHQSAARG